MIFMSASTARAGGVLGRQPLRLLQLHFKLRQCSRLSVLIGRFEQSGVEITMHSPSNDAVKGWRRPFEDPVPLPGGRQLVTLQEAADYIIKLPNGEQNMPEWQAATEALIMA